MQSILFTEKTIIIAPTHTNRAQCKIASFLGYEPENKAKYLVGSIKPLLFGSQFLAHGVPHLIHLLQVLLGD